MLWIKAFHIIAVICWFAAIFYLPRLFVYHSMAEDKVSRERFIIMERKLIMAIMNPSALLAIVLGAIMLLSDWDFYQNSLWMYIKLLMVALLVIFHSFCIYFARQLANGNNKHGDKFFRIFNELPVPLLVVIVIMAVVRPF